MNDFDETDVQRLIKVDIPHWQSGADNFTSVLFGLIQKADPGNRQKLRSLWPGEVEAFVRWQAERQKIIITGMLPVGSVMMATKDLHFCKANEKAVVYEHYHRTPFDQDNPYDHVGIGLIFQCGFYDGFSRKDLELCELVPCHHPPVPELADYTFINVQRLMQDYCDGIFDPGVCGYLMPRKWSFRLRNLACGAWLLLNNFCGSAHTALPASWPALAHG